MLKICTVCNLPKDETVDFNKDHRYRNGKRLAQCKACIRDYYRRKIETLREQIFAKLGHACVKCGFSDKRALQIDHIEGGGNQEHRTIRNTGRFLKKVLQDNAGLYQILCANCNWIKRAEQGENPVYELRTVENA